MNLQKKILRYKMLKILEEIEVFRPELRKAIERNDYKIVKSNGIVIIEFRDSEHEYGFSYNLYDEINKRFIPPIKLTKLIYKVCVER